MSSGGGGKGNHENITEPYGGIRWILQWYNQNPPFPLPPPAGDKKEMTSPSPFTSHEWPRDNFSLQIQYNIKHRSDENKVKYQLGDY